MHRSRGKYFIEIVIHVLFWTGVYYALKTLMGSSYSMVIDHGNGAVQRMNMRLLFPYSGVVLGSLMVLFYGCVFWLLKKVIRFKSDLSRVAVLMGWLMLVFGLNYLVIRVLTGPAREGELPSKPVLYGARTDTFLRPLQAARISFEARQDTVFNGASVNHGPQGARPDALLPAFPRPMAGSPADRWLSMQLAMAGVFLSILAIAAAYFFIKEWIRNDLTRSQAETQHLQTEIRLLRSQVSPHFFFNTLNNLFSMAQKRGHDDLADSISKLSGMMRYMIYESNTDTVPLQREIVYLEDCIALNKLRYADNEVTVTFRYPAAGVAAGVSLAPMLFVPFLENAFKHGVCIGQHTTIALDISVGGTQGGTASGTAGGTGNGTVNDTLNGAVGGAVDGAVGGTMNGAVGQKKLTFICTNTDHSSIKKLEEEKGGIGLENVRRRLELLYPGSYELRTGSALGEYTVNLQIILS